MFLRIKQWFMLPLFLSVILSMLLWGEIIGDAVRSALRLCVDTLIPSLFPLAVLSSWATRSGAAERIFYPWSISLGKLMRTDPKAVPAVFLGILGGYPIGALCLQQLREEGSVTRADAERLAACCTNAGPAFLVSVAGRQMLGSMTAGFLLLLVQTVASLLTMLLLRPNEAYKRTEYTPGKSKQMISSVPVSIAAASASMLNITGFVVISSVICRIVQRFTNNHSAAGILSGIIEVTNGLRAVSALSYTPSVMFILYSAMLGFSGLCVHLQVASVFLPSSIGLRNYFTGKLFHAGCATLISVPISLLLRVPSVAAMAPAANVIPLSLSIWGESFLLFSILYTFLWKFRKKAV